MLIERMSDETVYLECAQIRITGSGTNAGSNLVSFPGAYRANDPGVQVNIYDNKGSPYMGGKSYQIPGPAPLQCSGSGNGEGNGNQGGGEVQPPAGGDAGAAKAPLYTQCGGQSWMGPTVCESGVCKASNEWYSQCVPS
jgi:cellulase